MKPLRPHNYYGGTTCPGRATGQVRTIRSLIPEEDEMTDKQMAELKEYIDAKVTAARPLLTQDKIELDAKFTKVIDAMQAAHVVTRRPNQSGSGGLSETQVEGIVRRVLAEKGWR